VSDLLLRTARLDILPLAARAAGLDLSSRAAFERTSRMTVMSDWWESTGRHLLSYYVEWRCQPDEIGYGLWLIRERHDQVIIGSAGFKGIPNPDGLIEIGYGISAAYRRRGYTFEAAQALIDWAFEQPAVSGVVAECLRDNAGSRRILEKLGMQHTGSRDGYLYWKITRAQFSAARSIS
jgi:ribosomal-protein-alanine N-acetyltransferase